MLAGKDAYICVDFCLVADLSSLRMLKSLDLSSNGFYRPMGLQGDNSLRRLRNLEILDLSENLFNNSIFPFLKAATSLKRLFLRSNQLDGPFPDEVLPFLRKLEAVDLSGNEFSASSGLQGKSIHILCYSTKDGGQFPSCLFGLTRLRVLDLSSNQLTGKVPPALGSLGSLKYLSLLDNNFEGFFSLGSLANLSMLRVFKLGSESKSFQVESESYWKPKFQLSVIELPSCNLVKVPYFLLFQKDLSRIDLSNNKISGDFPHWLLVNNTKLEVLFLQNNSLTNFQLQGSAHNLGFLDVSDNDFNHLLPENIGWILPHLHYMKLANNGFHEFLPSSLGEFRVLNGLLLSKTALEGEIPISLFSLTALQLLDLSENTLSGGIAPQVNSQLPIVLLLQDNELSGVIPDTLLTGVSVLDLRNNRLSGNIPEFTNTQDTHTLLLRGNNLTDNELSGDIPAELGGLLELKALNLSHNKLSGLIPESFSGLKNVESLDLSFNRLQGRIPSQLTELSSLAVFNVSFNNLSGVIPQGKQFNTFGTKSYLGNPLLCGQLVINISCDSSNFQEPDNGMESDESIVDMVSFYWSLAAAYVTILLGIFSSLCFDSPWSRFWFYIVDAFIHKAKNLW
ncbi:unnamed protein product [Eruca vesicaria subsp. sativa]|uniref:Uncharacterized protein n=1 Tax=Eruca vesicaria subsp. sativa TaxID=29727 RepID=A0ABC8KVQ2_ERUVS|nr:unnamed protein product [Eruca vesicaria subsp. sativa]